MRVVMGGMCFASLRTDADTIADPRPAVTQWQLVEACFQAGITRPQINAAVALLSPKRQRFWENIGGHLIDRDNPFAGALRANLSPSPTPAQWTAIFVAASLLDPFAV